MQRPCQFGADCFHCPAARSSATSAFHNNGLDTEDAAKDWGRFLVTTNHLDLAKFQTPSLRNVAVTVPLMAEDQRAVVAFLGTLTDRGAGTNVVPLAKTP